MSARAPQFSDTVDSVTILGANTDNPGVPHYGSGAAVTGSVIFLALMAAVLAASWLRRRK
ncbi:hypothetical protein GCM10009839_27370 [Catenulispora yoronensis]|uniref:Gram-positive cocci surface proteins LPxTG domain-containing protein n=1 Tax=Catenulispora yoronensis TaxID=450799 RepID=A0ABP5FIE7_9ACTN